MNKLFYQVSYKFKVYLNLSIIYYNKNSYIYN